MVEEIKTLLEDTDRGKGTAPECGLQWIWIIRLYCAMR